jgi:hypothetical protein
MSAVVGTHAARQVNPAFDRGPDGEGRTFDVDGLQIAVPPRSGEARTRRRPHATVRFADSLVGNGGRSPFHAYFDLATGCPEGNTRAATTYPAGSCIEGDRSPPGDGNTMGAPMSDSATTSRAPRRPKAAPSACSKPA